MHPNFVVYNPHTLVKLRDAVGEEIGANCDLSHLFWQGCDPIETIRFLGKQGALFHAHMKDTLIVKELAAQTGVLNFSEEPGEGNRGLSLLSRGRLWPWRATLEGRREGLHGRGLPGNHQHRK